VHDPDAGAGHAVRTEEVADVQADDVDEAKAGAEGRHLLVEHHLDVGVGR
jgi:hypothetical protein